MVGDNGALPLRVVECLSYSKRQDKEEREREREGESYVRKIRGRIANVIARGNNVHRVYSML